MIANFSKYAFIGTFVEDPKNPLSPGELEVNKLSNFLYFPTGPPIG